MKKLIALCMIVSCAGLSLAQDIIALNSGERIENVTVSAITDQEIIYVNEGSEIRIPRNSVNAVLYADGRYEEIPAINKDLGDSTKSTYSDVIEDNPFYQCYEYDAKGRPHLKVLYFDKSYSKECRKIGKQVYYREYTTLYKIAFDEAKKSGLSNQKAMIQAVNKCMPVAIKISDEAVRKCAGEL